MTGTMWKRHPTTNDWAVYGPRNTVAVGAEVTVTTRSGKTTTHYIAATARGGRGMVYGFPGHNPNPEPSEPVLDCQIDMFCTGHCADDDAHAAYTAAQTARETTQARRGPRSMCQCCGEHRAAVVVRDRNGIPGRACTTCANDPSELSFH